MKKVTLFLLFGIFLINELSAQHSVARQWNEVLLQAIRDDFARPTVHARNLFHTSIAMYDSWAVYDDSATPYLLGKSVHGFEVQFEGMDEPSNLLEAREETLSYAVFRLLHHRFRFSPGAEETQSALDDLFATLGYDASFVSTDYSGGDPAALGNYIAESIINYGLQDGSNEEFDYINQVYQPVNEALLPKEEGNPDITDPNRWQPLALDVFIDQSGNEIPLAPEFLSPEWGQVSPFAMNGSHLTTHERDEIEWQTYYDPGAPPYIDDESSDDVNPYKWGFSLVSVWSAHLDPSDNVQWDISPGNIGNNPEFPTSFDAHDDFYNLIDGGDQSRGHDLNPVTEEPYASQMVPRADYARVLAEFWADGPDSETPPGHWFTILNYVNDHPMFEKRYKGEGEELDALEWDVKAYLLMGGAMHDAAISAWGVKGYYDYIRPVSAIRYMAEMGQSTNPSLTNYNERGIPLIDGYIEIVEAGDPLAGASDENVGKIKLFAWRGPDYIADPESDLAGVGWILAGNWWPYQRPTFVTPPFAGYVSGHSTYSRAAAEVMTLLTGDAYFPGGMGEFLAPQNEFLVFEEGPSVDVTLQWATYRDASDQTSLSRIWGGIHPPADDIPGRLMGEKIGIAAFNFADAYFTNTVLATGGEVTDKMEVFPNPIKGSERLTLSFQKLDKVGLKISDLNGKVLYRERIARQPSQSFLEIDLNDLQNGIYLITINDGHRSVTQKFIIDR